MGVEIIYDSDLVERLNEADGGADFRDGLDEETAETNQRVQVVELSLAAVLEIAKAAQHCRTLAELNRATVRIDGQTVPLRRTLRSVEEICCDPRRIVALMLRAADNHDWAWCNFWAAFCPEMTQKQMAGLLKVNASTVKYHLDNVQLPEDAYDFIPENRT